MRKTKSHPTTRRGSVLVAVLAVVMLLSFLVTRFLNEALEDLEYRALFNEPIEMRTLAFSLMEHSLAVIQEIALIDEGALHAPEQGWGDPLGYARFPIPDGWEVNVRIDDESGKLPLNTMDEALLNRLLEEMLEIDYGTTRELSSTLLDWIDPDDSRRLNGAESDDYLNRDPPYRAANRPLQSLEELRLLEVWDETFFDEEGSPTALYDQFASMVSVHFAGPVNLNQAPPSVLELLALEDGYDDERIFDGLPGDKRFLDELPGAADPGKSGVAASLLRVTVSIFRGDVPYTITALVEPKIDTEGSGTAGNAPGRGDEDLVRTGSREEQDALNYPFTILQLSEFSAPDRAGTPAARYSVIDIDRD